MSTNFTKSRAITIQPAWVESLRWNARRFLGESVMCDKLPQELVNGEIHIKDAEFIQRSLENVRGPKQFKDLF